MKQHMAMAVFACAMALVSRSEELKIVSLERPGRLTFSTVTNASTYRVEWAPSPSGPWTNFAAAAAELDAIAAGTSGVVTASVPMCYRVIATITNNTPQVPDLLTPAYYTSSAAAPFVQEVSNFLGRAQDEPFRHPLENALGQIPDYSVPTTGVFGAGKGPTGTSEHHPAVDLRIGEGETNVVLYAAHTGYVATYKDSAKYRHYLSVSTNVMDNGGQVIGQLVTLYAHIDLDLDEADALFMDGQRVETGDIVSRHLYTDTVGGPHLHFEIRYYRAGDVGNETFYGAVPPGDGSVLTQPSAGPWSYGKWDPDVGYGFGDFRNHGLEF